LSRDKSKGKKKRPRAFTGEFGRARLSRVGPHRNLFAVKENVGR